jgi:Protein of unknown function (DUF1573)
MFSLAALLCALILGAQQPALVPKAVVDKTTHDFGTVGLGTMPEIDFPIHNTGPAPLQLTITYLPRGLRLVNVDKAIPPGGTGNVRVGIDTFSAGNSTEWHVNVLTNDPDHGSIDLTIKADVRQFLALTPPSARFTFVQFGAEGGTTHVLSAVDQQPLEVLGVDSPFDYIHATSRELTGKDRVADIDGRQWQIALTILPTAPVGPISGYVVVRTNHPQQPRAFLPVSGFVRPLFAVTPPSVNLSGMVAITPAVPLLSLVVKNFGADPLELTSASSDITGLVATILPTEAGHVWRVELRLSPAAPQTMKGTLLLKTTSKNVPELTVPIQR